MTSDTQHSVISKLRILSQFADTPQIRLSVGRRLRSVTLEPASLPPSAILIIRQVPDPLPGEFGLDSIMVKRRWSRALRESIDDKYRSAARPYRGVIEGSADAVLFRDQAELVASLCADLAKGLAFQRWWWRQLLSASAAGQTFPGTVRRQLLRKPESISAVICLLRDWGCAEEVLTTITRNEAAMVTTAMLNAYDLALLDEQIHSASDSSSDIQIHVADKEIADRLDFSGTSSMSGKRRAVSLAPELPAELVPYADRIDHSLPAEQATLLMLSDILSLSPLMLRHIDIQQAIIVWHASRCDNAVQTWPRMDDTERSEHSAGKASHLQQHKGDTTRKKGDRVYATEQAKASDLQSPTQVSKTVAHLVRDELLDEISRETAPRDTTSISPVEFEHGVYTRLGGILYLINIFEHIGWPHDVLTEAFRSAPPGPWCTVDAVARLLIGRQFESCRSDEIWKFLAELDGRAPDDLLGAELSLTDPCVLAESWSSLLPASMRIVRTDKPVSEMSERLKFDDLNFSDALADWLAFAFPLIKRILEVVLANEQKRTNGIPDWLICPGTLYSTQTHIDLVSSMQYISMPVRQSGLDRDPGWCASLGRVVQIRFDGGEFS